MDRQIDRSIDWYTYIYTHSALAKVLTHDCCQQLSHEIFCAQQHDSSGDMDMGLECENFEHTRRKK